MLVTDREGVLMGALVRTAQPAEIRLAEATLKLVIVPYRWRKCLYCANL